MDENYDACSVLFIPSLLRLHSDPCPTNINTAKKKARVDPEQKNKASNQHCHLRALDPDKLLTATSTFTAT